ATVLPPTPPAPTPTPAPKALRLALVRRFTGHTDRVVGLDVSPDGQRVLSGSVDNTAALWDINGGPPLLGLPHPETVRGVAFLPNGRHIITGGGDQEDAKDFAIRLWDLDTSEELQRLPGHKDRINCLSLSADGCWLITSGDDGLVRLWDLTTWQQVR